MTFGLSSRLLLVMSAVLVSTAGALGYILITDAQRTISQNKIYRAELIASTLAKGSLDAVISKEYELLEGLLQSATPFENFAYAYFTKLDNTIMAHTYPDMVSKKVELGMPKRGASIYWEREFRGKKVVEIKRPVQMAGKHLANVHLGFFVQSDPLYSNHTVIRMGIILLIAVGLMVVLTMVSLRWFLGPMEKLARTIAKTPDDYSLSMDQDLLKRNDEVGLVARNIDGLVKRLANSFSELLLEKERAQITLNAIADAVISIDVDGAVQFMNEIAQKLSGWSLEEAQGKPLSEILILENEKRGEPIKSDVYRCISHGCNCRSVQNKILLSRLGERYLIQESSGAILNENGDVIGAVLVLNDVTELRQMATELNRQAMHDSLTGLINRYEFERLLETALFQAKHDGCSHIVAFLDIDRFKVINDTLGHVVGDELIKQVAEQLLKSVQGKAILARLGGDAFAFLFQNSTLNLAYDLLEKALNQLHTNPFEWEGRIIEVNASIGLVSVDGASVNTVQILADADVACYTAKELGRNRIYVFGNKKESSSHYQNDMVQATKLKDALVEEALILYAQPILKLSCGTSAKHHFEVLLRMRSEDGHIFSPGALIPSAERFDYMLAVDRWVVETVCVQYGHLFVGNDVLISINLSGNSLSDPGFLNFVEQCIADNNIPGECLCFEITETAAIRHMRIVAEFIDRMHELNVKFALDDFGSGLSSFMYLKEMSVDYLKIDGSFVRDMVHNKIDRAMVAAITEIARTMGIETIAEFVCHMDIIPLLEQLEVDYAQGFAISEPMPLETAVKIIPSRTGLVM